MQPAQETSNILKIIIITSIIITIISFRTIIYIMMSNNIIMNHTSILSRILDIPVI